MAHETLRKISEDERRTFNDISTEVHEEWFTTPYGHEITAGSQNMYDEMARVYEGRIRTHNDATEWIRDTTTIASGIEVTSRFLYMGALAAAQEGLNLNQLACAVKAPGSFLTLQLLTREHKGAAKEIEYETGLKCSRSIDSQLASQFTISEAEGLQITTYPKLRYQSRSRLNFEGRLTDEEAFSVAPDKDPIRCPANRNGMVAKTYKLMASIAIRDPNLFQATLSSHV